MLGEVSINAVTKSDFLPSKDQVKKPACHIQVIEIEMIEYAMPDKNLFSNAEYLNWLISTGEAGIEAMELCSIVVNPKY